MSRLNPNAGAFVPSFSAPVAAAPAAAATSTAAATPAASKAPVKAARSAPVVAAQATASVAAKAATPSTKAMQGGKAAAATTPAEGSATLDDVDMDGAAAATSDRLVYSIDYLLQFQPICDTVPCYFPDVVRAPAPPRLGRYIHDRLVYTVPELLHFQPLYQMFPPDLEWSETLAIVVESMDKKPTAPTKPSKKEKAKAKAAAAAAAAASAATTGDQQLQYDPTLMCYFNPTEYAAALNMAVYGSTSATSTGAAITGTTSLNGKLSAADGVNAAEEAALAKRRLVALLDDVQPESVPDVLTKFEAIEISCTHTLQEIISLLFDRAIAAPALCDAYAQLCSGMAERTPEFKEGAKTINFRRILLTRCYEALIEEPETASIPPASNGAQNGSATTSSVSPPQHSWRRQCMLQNVCLIGELFRRQLLTENVMHVCVAMMLEDEVNPQMDVIDAACRLLMLVGDLLDGSSPASRRTMDEYFDVLQRLADHNVAQSSLKETIAEMTSVRAGGWTKKRLDVSGSPAKTSVTSAVPLAPLATTVAATITGEPKASPAPSSDASDSKTKAVSAASS